MSDNKVRYFHPDYPSIRMIAEADYDQLKSELEQAFICKNCGCLNDKGNAPEIVDENTRLKEALEAMSKVYELSLSDREMLNIIEFELDRAKSATGE